VILSIVEAILFDCSLLRLLTAANLQYFVEVSLPKISR